jgi:SAM-dependent methyltransferase
MTPRAKILETYLAEIAHTRATGAGVEETSYYAALANALNEVGRSLKPKVQCVLQLANNGAGLPDGGLFTADQCKARDLAAPLLGQIPARGVIEVKGPGHDLGKLVRSEQVGRYWESYRLVLATNYRAMALVGDGPDGKPVLLEQFVLAKDEVSFWQLAQHPHLAEEELGALFAEYLRRVLLHKAPLAAPRDVAGILASYARDALARVEHADTPALASLRTALSEALGLQFEGERGEHFFRSTLVQTLFYGLFSAWVIWSRSGRRTEGQSYPQMVRDTSSPMGPRPARFDWRTAEWSLRLPVIRVLFEQVATPSKLGPLGLVEVLDWAAAALERVDEVSFFKSFDEGSAVQYFYEPFLEAFDPVLRKDLGVWYTPEEIVKYQVARVDAVLREELDIADGLADPNVYVLDPCCGTGAYLRAVLAKIEETLRAKGGDALVANDLKRAAMDRVFGFEILPAPFVIAHLQLGLLLQKAGAPLSDPKSERVGVYLTNALVGWEPPAHEKAPLIFKEMEEERDAADRVKRDTPILVVLGNPPYNAFAGTSPEEEKGLVEPYKAGLIKDWGIKKFNLDDLYVRFFRIAEKRITESTGRGVVSFISNFSYISDPSYVVMRQRLLAGFDKIWIDCLNGDSRATGKLTPEGKPDPSVFSTERNSEGIRVGTAIGMFVKRGLSNDSCAAVGFRQFWGATKRADLLASSDAPDINAMYESAAPSKENRFSFRPGIAGTAYQNWPRVIDLCASPPGNGLMEKRGGALIDVDREVLRRRMQRYFDSSVAWATLVSEQHPLTYAAAGYTPEAARLKGLQTEKFSDDRIVRYAVRPFDTRWCYYSRVPTLWNRTRPTLWSSLERGSPFLISRLRPAKAVEGPPIAYSRIIFDDHFLAPDAVGIPLSAGPCTRTSELFSDSAVAAADLSSRAIAYLQQIGGRTTISPDDSRVLWMHALALAYSTIYQSQNVDALRRDWPRIPLPVKRDTLLASANLGNRIAALLDVDTPVLGVTLGTIELAYRDLGGIHRADGRSIDLETGDLDVNAGWGHTGGVGVVMPGRGRITDHGDVLDIWLNDRVFWRNVPRPVWEYTIGGYQIIKKWLSYRETALLGRALTPEEARYVTEMVRRIAALVAMQPELDANYEAVRSDTADFPVSK